MVRYDRYSVVQVPEVVAKSGTFLIHFYSDVAYNMTGFNITFRFAKKKDFFKYWIFYNQNTI